MGTGGHICFGPSADRWGSTLRGLAINSFKLNGVLITSNGNKVEGCFIGLDADGVTAAPNLLDGVQVTGSSNVVGGGTLARPMLSPEIAAMECLLQELLLRTIPFWPTPSGSTSEN